MKTVGFTETVLRDGNQSLIATRMPFSDFEGILATMDKAGYYSVECWGGATFDSCLRYLNEDPWERLRKIRKAMPNTKLQMLLRGQNLLGYKPYPDDVVRKFVEYSVKNGIDIIRIFDALNDPVNLRVAIEETKKQGAHASGAISFTLSPIHNTENYVNLAKEYAAMGADSICIKDMSGIMGPGQAYDLVRGIKDVVDLPLVIHTHCTTGLALMTCMKSVEAGADVIDTAISSFSGGTSQPPTESLVYALREMGFDVKLNEKILKEINDFFRPIKDKALETNLLNPYVLGTETDGLIYQVPGGMLSNLISQLKAQNAMDKFNEALEEIPRVKEDLGYPPLVTPMSQMTGVQAVVNVLLGERYKTVSNEIRSYLRGEYGRAPGKVNEDLIKKILGNEKPMTTRFADTLEPIFEKTKAQLAGLARSDEDVLSYIAFPQIAEKFFKDRAEAEMVQYAIRRID